jgi:DNA repair protein RadC
MRFIVSDHRPVFVLTAPDLSFEEVDTPEKIYRFFLDHVAAEPSFETSKEHVVVICLNAHRQSIGWNLVSVGSLTEAHCQPREVLRPVIVRAAASFVICHNHPSGNPTPSHADVQMTRRIRDAADLFQIRMDDHVVIGMPAPDRKAYFSFTEAGTL